MKILTTADDLKQKLRDKDRAFQKEKDKLVDDFADKEKEFAAEKKKFQEKEKQLNEDIKQLNHDLIDAKHAKQKLEEDVFKLQSELR